MIFTMIPLAENLRIILLLFNIYKIYKVRFSNDDPDDIIFGPMYNNNMSISILRIIFLICKYIHYGAHKVRRRRLVKPNVLLQLMHGYR